MYRRGPPTGGLGHHKKEPPLCLPGHGIEVVRVTVTGSTETTTTHLDGADDRSWLDPLHHSDRQPAGTTHRDHASGYGFCLPNNSKRSYGPVIEARDADPRPP